MKITRKQLRQIIGEGYNSMSSAGKAHANAVKRKFMKLYPDAKVGIDGREGWITVNGKKAINMSQASGSPMTDEEMIEKMHAVYAGEHVDADVPTSSSRMNTFREGKMKITKRQLRRIIKEERAKLNEAPLLANTDEAQEQIEAILNNLYDQGVDNRGLIEILEQIIGDIQNGFVGEPT